MSSYLYGDVTQKRAAAPPGESTGAEPPGVKTYVDTFAALVPAEVLALQAFITGLVVQQETAGGVTQAKIEHPDVVKYSFVALLVVSVLLYLIGLKRWPKRWDFLRMLIPPLAFAGWTALQPDSVFDVVAPGFSGVPAEVTAVILAVVLGVLANRLGVVADKAAPDAGS
ncbi:hypothetical protein ACWEVP_37475 [Amycolatopsis sp. NPDC003865]